MSNKIMKFAVVLLFSICLIVLIIEKCPLIMFFISGALCGSLIEQIDRIDKSNNQC